MKRILLALTAVALMSGVALAEVDTNGVVKSYDADKRVITLEDGKTFTVEPDVAVPELMAGQKVTVTVDDNRGNQVVRVQISP